MLSSRYVPVALSQNVMGRCPYECPGMLNSRGVNWPTTSIAKNAHPQPTGWVRITVAFGCQKLELRWTRSPIPRVLSA